MRAAAPVCGVAVTGGGGVLLVVPEKGIGVQAWRQMREASGGQARLRPLPPPPRGPR